MPSSVTTKSSAVRPATAASPLVTDASTVTISTRVRNVGGWSTRATAARANACLLTDREPLHADAARRLGHPSRRSTATDRRDRTAGGTPERGRRLVLDGRELPRFD